MMFLMSNLIKTFIISVVNSQVLVFLKMSMIWS
jgi:hypothetical protein